MGSQVMTGAKAIFRINNTQIAFASSVSYEETIQLEEVNVLDHIETLEHAEVGYRVTLNCNTFRVQNKSVKQLGIMPKFKQILTSGVITAEVIDRVTNTVILNMQDVKLESRSTQIDSRGLATETWSFRGRISSDETA